MIIQDAWTGGAGRERASLVIGVVGLSLVLPVLVWVQIEASAWLPWALLLGAGVAVWLWTSNFKYLAIIYIPSVLLTPNFFRNLDFVARGIRPDFVILAIALLLVVITGVIARRMVVPRTLSLLFLLYLISVATSTVLASLRETSSESTLTDLVSLQGVARPFVVFLLFSLILNNVRQVRLVIGTIAISGALVVLLGILQFGRIGSVVDLTARFYDKSEGQVLFSGRGPVVGTFDGLHNSFAVFLVMLIALTLTLALGNMRSLTENRRIGLWLLGGLALIPLLATFSRIGVVGMAVALLIVVFVLGARSIHSRFSYLAGFTGFALLAVILVQLSTSSIFIRFVDGLSLGAILNDPRFSELYPALKDIFLAHPLFGSGLNLGTAADDAGYIGALAKTGIIGTFLFLLMIGYVARVAIRVWRYSPVAVYRAVAATLIATTAAFLVMTVAGSPFWSVRTVEIYWILVAVLMFADRQLRADSVEVSPGQSVTPAPRPARRGDPAAAVSTTGIRQIR